MATAKGIVMTEENVLSLLAKRKGRFMDVIKPQPTVFDRAGKPDWAVLKPRYKVGTELYVKEGYYASSGFKAVNNLLQGRYLADDYKFAVNLNEHEWNLWWNRKYKFRPTSGRFMYKSLARIFLPPIEKITVQRPQDLTLNDIVSEGWPDAPRDREIWIAEAVQAHDKGFKWFMNLWNSLHKNGWEKSEWCFVYHWRPEDIEIK